MAASPPLRFPRVSIEFCVQCKWNLRAAYFAQELLQTFSTSIGEIALIPMTGGVFTITLYHQDIQVPESDSQEGRPSDPSEAEVGGDTSDVSPNPFVTTMIWDRKRDGGFPETKELKNRVRNIIEPGKDMGHVDRALRKGKASTGGEDEKAEGTGKKDEEKTDDTVKHGEATDGVVSVASEQTTQAEKQPDIKSPPHADHKSVSPPPDDCEECREAAKLEEDPKASS